MNSILRMFPHPKENRKLIKTPLTHDSNRLARSNHPTIENIFTTFLLFEKCIFENLVYQFLTFKIILKMKKKHMFQKILFFK